MVLCGVFTLRGFGYGLIGHHGCLTFALLAWWRVDIIYVLRGLLCGEWFGVVCACCPLGGVLLSLCFRVLWV